MSVALTHLLVGALVGLAISGRLRDVPLFAALAEVHDLDHVYWVLGQADPFWLDTRGSFHNLFVVAILPGVLAGFLLAQPWLTARWRAVVFGAPVVLTSHTVLDLFDIPQNLLRPFGGVRLWYPLDGASYLVNLGSSYDPRLVDPLAVGLGCVAALLLVTLVLRHRWERAEGRHRLLVAAAFAVLFAVVVPVGLSLAATRF